MVSALRLAYALLASLTLAHPVAAHAWQLIGAITPAGTPASAPTELATAPAVIDVADIPSLADMDQRLAERARAATGESGTPAVAFARRLATIEAAVEDPFWRTTSAELIEVARSTEGVAAVPAPIVLFDGMGNVAMEFIVRAWTLEYDNAGAIRSLLVGRLYETLLARGICLAHAAAEVYPPQSQKAP